MYLGSALRLLGKVHRRRRVTVAIFKAVIGLEPRPFVFGKRLRITGRLLGFADDLRR
jgi:hypothetical protein